MSTDSSLTDRRESFRCPVADSRQGCVLQVGDTRLPGRLVDESAGGFSVLVQRPLGLVLDVGQTAELGSDSGWFKVRLMHVAEAEPPEGGDAKSSEEEPSSWCRLGLLRVRDIPPDEPMVSVFVRDRCCGLQQWFPSHSLLTASSLLLVLAMIAVPLGLVAINWQAERSVPANNSGGTGFAANRSGFGSSEFVFPGGGEALQGPRAKGKERLGQSRDRLPGNAALIPPEVARHLHLTKDQQEQIRHLENAMAEAIRKLRLDSGLQGDTWRHNVERRDELLDQSRRQARKLLTEEQCAQWETLFAEPPQTEQAPAR